MLYVTYSDNSTQAFWIKQGEIPNPSDVVSIQADGDELNLILSMSYPNHGKCVQHYYGDTAKQICMNW